MGWVFLRLFWKKIWLFDLEKILDATPRRLLARHTRVFRNANVALLGAAGGVSSILNVPSVQNIFNFKIKKFLFCLIIK